MSLQMQAVSYAVAEKTLVSDLNIEVAEGEVVGLIGPNGAGKSTALKLMAGTLKPNGGDVTLQGENIQKLPPLQLALTRSVMAQSASVVFDFSVLEIVEMGWVQGHLYSAAQRRLAIEQVVSDCDIEELLSRRFNTLSGGEQQRVQFTRNLLQLWRPETEPATPRYLLLDEPTASMDIRHELKLLEQVRCAARQNIGVLMVLHDLNLAARFMDRVVLMQDGSVIQSGLPADVFNEPLLSEVYQTPIQVEQHQGLNRLVIHA